MYYKLLGCKILEREIASVVYKCKNNIDVTMIRQKLHDTPTKLAQVLKEEVRMIDEHAHRYSNHTEERDYDAILLGFGLCSYVVEGLCSSRYPLVIPKAHDCITLLMGNKERYLDYYKEHPGTFYYSPGFAETGIADETDIYERKYQMYLQRYKGNERRARRAVEIESEMMVNYKGITYIEWESLPIPEYMEKAKRIADNKGWDYEQIKGDDSLLKDLVDGNWDKDRFLVVMPGNSIAPSYDKEILKEKIWIR